MNTINRKPVIGYTMGDPAGIGAEILTAGWKKITTPSDHRHIVFGDPMCMKRAANTTDARIDIQTASSLEEAVDISANPTKIAVIPTGPPEASSAAIGQVSSLAGQAAYAYLQSAIESAQLGSIDAIVTTPLNKEAIRLAGLEFPGHTEILADRCDVENFAMMLYIPAGQQVGGDIGIGVVHTTLHQSLRNALDEITTDNIVNKCQLADEFATACLKQKGLSRAPRIAVAALNPHAGENGLFGDEESKIIAPAVSRARQLGIDCYGPISCDTLMGRAVSGEFDLVIALYHDQGHIALKLLGMHKAVNVTLGLPIIRTSVAHGTAFEIAGTGQADPTSLFKSVEVAENLIAQRVLESESAV